MSEKERLNQIRLMAITEFPNKQWNAAHDHKQVQVYHSIFPITVLFGTERLIGIRVSSYVPADYKAAHAFATAVRDAANMAQALVERVRMLPAQTGAA